MANPVDLSRETFGFAKEEIDFAKKTAKQNDAPWLFFVSLDEKLMQNQKIATVMQNPEKYRYDLTLRPKNEKPKGKERVFKPGDEFTD